MVHYFHEHLERFQSSDLLNKLGFRGYEEAFVIVGRTIALLWQFFPLLKKQKTHFCKAGVAPVLRSRVKSDNLEKIFMTRYLMFPG